MSDTNPSPDNISPAIEKLEVLVKQLEQDRPLPTIAVSSPEVQAWLSEWVQAVYARQPLPELPQAYGVPASAAGVALLEAFNGNVQSLVAQYPEEHRKNQLIPVLVLARALGAWQEAFYPSPSDWMNMRTNLGYYQQKHEKEWREQFEGPRPSALTWLNRLPEALNYELTEIQITRMNKRLKASENAAPRFWSIVLKVWASQAVEHKQPMSISDNFVACSVSIDAALAYQEHSRENPTDLDVDTFPPFVQNLQDNHTIYSMAVPVRDYHKGWDHHVRTLGRQFALNQAKTHFPNGMADDVNDRVAHLKYIDQYYDQFERAFEPWRWNGLADASVDEKACTWAWLTSWAPEYNWDQAVKAMGIHPPVEAVGREYTGQSTQWWLTASFDDKWKAAKTWIEGASYEMDNARKAHCNMDDFIGGMFNR